MLSRFSLIQLCSPRDYSPPGSSVHGILQARILEWVAILFSRDLPNPGIKPGSPTLQADSLLSEPPGKPERLYDPASPLLGVFFSKKETLIEKIHAT